MKKLLTFLFIFLIGCSVNAKSLKNEFTDIIFDSGISKNSISISIKKDDGKDIYNLNEKILVHPASVQKILTLPAAIDVLGDDYQFTTTLYKRDDKTYILKLGADPYLKTDDLKTFASKINNETIQNLYIDDSIIESKDWGEGWQWDDNLNLAMPKFNSYNIDNNLFSITIMPDGKIINPSRCPIIFINNLVQDKVNNIKVSRDNSYSSNTITLSGTINNTETVVIPINNLKRYFNIQLTKTLEDNKIYLKTAHIQTKVNKNDKKIVSVEHPVSTAVKDVLENSNNMVSESLTKIASSKFYTKTGTDADGVMLFDEYCKKLNIDSSSIRLVDASGVSKNNLATADFITEYLLKQKDNKILQYMAKPGTGTLSERMIPLQNNLRAKTGTLSDISSIAGYLTSKSGQNYIFCIIINDPKSTNSEKKLLEDYLIRQMYLKL